MERKLSHLQMIQGIVNRLSQNSFLLKGWSVILVAALFALAAGNSRIHFIYLAYFPSVAFWLLDGYFLRQERLFRALYDYVRDLDEENIDFSMDTSVVQDKVKSWLRIVISKTLLVFHGTIVGAIVVVMLTILHISKGGA